MQKTIFVPTIYYIICAQPKGSYMTFKERQIILYYLKNMFESDFEPEDSDIFFHNVSRYSVDLFGFSFREMMDNMQQRLSSDDKPIFLTNLVSGKIDFNNLISNPEIASKYQEIVSSKQSMYNADITSESFDKNFCVICDAFDIPAYCRPLLQFIIYNSKIPLLSRLVRNFTGSIRDDFIDESNEDFLASICHMSVEQIKQSLAINGPFFNSGIFVKTFSDCELSPMFKKTLNMQFETPRDVKNELLGAPLKTDLTSDNFDYMANDYECIKNILEQAIKNKTTGINILLYGLPGCGKTELAKSVCSSAGLCLYSTSVKSEEKDSRLSNLAQTQQLLKNDNEAVVLFDEAEDVFSLLPFFKSSPSKLYINNRLEHNKKPVIWITNKINDMDRAYIRRFTLAVKVTDPDERAKTNAWQRVFDKYDFKISDTELAKLIKKYSVPMSLVDTAVKNAKMLNDEKMLEYTLDNLTNAMTGVTPANKISNGVKFDPNLLNTDKNLEELANQICNKKVMNFSLCLYGAPGTGKTAFADYLGEKMGLNVIKKRASDILNAYVGGTEKNIAAAFSEARAKKAILVFDEADSFLQDRSRAVRSWEISCVNEMLTQMENAEYPFICTTNLMDNLDKASLRRFSFKVKYDFLKPEQIVCAFKDFFGKDVSLNQISNLVYLTPGDFVTVKKQSEFMDINDVNVLIKMLADEQQTKKMSNTQKIGF